MVVVVAAAVVAAAVVAAAAVVVAAAAVVVSAAVSAASIVHTVTWSFGLYKGVDVEKLDISIKCGACESRQSDVVAFKCRSWCLCYYREVTVSGVTREVIDCQVWCLCFKCRSWRRQTEWNSQVAGNVSVELWESCQSAIE